MQNLPTLATSSLLLDVSRFEHAQRVAKMLASSTMVPDHFKNNVGNCVIALNYADRLGVDPFMCMTKMYVIHGKPAIETQLQIALFNKSDRFTSLKYEMSGEGDARQCVAYATEKETNEIVEGPPVSLAMAKKEGWGKKWTTLPDLMLRYRSAAFFIRLHAPETTLGLSTTEEVMDSKDIIDITPDKEVFKEIEDHANTEVLDIEIQVPESAQTPDSPAEMTAQEKAEIMEKESVAATDGPGF